MPSRNACRLRSSDAGGGGPASARQSPGSASARSASRAPRPQIVHVHLLRPAVLAPARRPARLPRKAPRAPQPNPVRRPVACARVARRVHERLRQQHRMAVRVPNVPGQPPQAQAQRPRRQVRHPAGGKNREAGVVRDQMQPRELPLPLPADPRVPNPHLERARLPAQQRQPRLAPNRHVPQRLADPPAEGQKVVLAQQRVPLLPQMHAVNWANLHLAQPVHSAPAVRQVHGDVLSQRLLNGHRKPTEDVGYAPSGLLNSPGLRRFPHRSLSELETPILSGGDRAATSCRRSWTSAGADPAADVAAGKVVGKIKRRD